MQLSNLCLFALTVIALSASRSHASSFSRSLGSLADKKLAQETRHLNPVFRRIASLAQKQVANSMVMLFDESRSVGAPHFGTSKEFAQDVIVSESSAVDGEMNMEIGVAKFGHAAAHVLPLTTSAGDALMAVEDMEYASSDWTNIADGLTKAGELLEQSRGQKLILLWTDGKHNTGGDPVAVASKLKSQGVCIIVIAIGDEVDNLQLARIEGCSDTPQPVAPDHRGIAGGAPAPQLPPECTSSLLVSTDFDEIEQDVSAFLSRVQGVLETRTRCPV